MERWRSFFEKSKADIWTVIHQAIAVAAADYPKDFRVRRDQIAETLFDRSLLKKHVKIDFCEEGEVEGASPAHMLKAPINAGNIAENGRLYDDDAEALSDELEEEALILRDLHCIKATLADVDQSENALLEALQRLQYMQISVDNLKATEIGKHVKCLKKHSSQRVKAIAKELMRQWKVLVDEWIISVKDVAAMATTATPRTDCPEEGNHGAGLLAPPLDEGALLETGVQDVDLSQLFNFVDGEDFCTGIMGSPIPSNSIEPSVKDNISYLCRSQSGSMLTECNEFDIKASTGHSWGLTTPEERGSATRDKYPPSCKVQREKGRPKRQANLCGKTKIDDDLRLSKTIANGSGPGRPCNEILTAKPLLGAAREKTSNNDNSMSQSNVLLNRPSMNASIVGRSCARAKPTSDFNSLDRSNQSSKNEIDKKLVIAKRKLHQGYQQAENAKKQRTVQILSSSNLPSSSQAGKGRMNTNVHSKELLISGHEARAKVNARVQIKEVMEAKINVPVHNKSCFKNQHRKSS